MSPPDRPTPPNSLLRHQARQGAFTDAYARQVPRTVSLAEFVEAFYTTRLFRFELALIALLGKPSTAAMVRAVATGGGRRLAVWTAEARTADELLMRDDSGATCSWFKVESAAGGQTLLWFGSAIQPRRRGADGQLRFSLGFHALLGFHRRYSRALLRAAVRRLEMAC
ncbi:hypothetical protein [Pelomonas cellulosilytica]|uniref:DUF2867 domain-containing protein n=1 Tax=Pelomonas cellulosilytica TaxID=2906762 RepID=A0ABS8XSP2_9BURK|nr:hypothetical protein [Pelomonas sp. P8]MCE4555722.1 hypothetical protein [Pelomonas sp. P8]